MAHDGNCFYRAVALLLELGEQEFGALKEQFSRYFLEHEQEFSVWGETGNLAEKIARDGVYASYRMIRVAADCLRRPIHIHRQEVPSQRYEDFQVKDADE